MAAYELVCGSIFWPMCFILANVGGTSLCSWRERLDNKASENGIRDADGKNEKLRSSSKEIAHM